MSEGAAAAGRNDVLRLAPVPRSVLCLTYVIPSDYASYESLSAGQTWEHGTVKLFDRLIPLVLLLIVAVYAFRASVYKPFHNWDMIMYVAAAKSFEERDVKSLHTFTYDAVRSSVSEAKYESLIQGEYRHAIRTDPSAFNEQLPFYQIRPVYNGLIYLLYKAGIDIGFATHLISGVAVVVALAVLYLLSVSFLGRPSIYAVPFLVVIFGVTDLARYSTPDGMAFLAIIFSAYLYLKQRILLLLIFLPIMLCIRTDLILFAVPLLLFILAFWKGFRKKAVLSMLMSVLVYVVSGAYWENPGWSTIFYFTFIQRLSHPLSTPPTLTVYHYLYVLFDGIRALPNNRTFALYGLFSAYALYIIINRTKREDLFHVFHFPPIVMSVVCIMFVIGHFLFFPVAWDRFLSGPYLIGAFSLLVMMTDYQKVLNSG